MVPRGHLGPPESSGLESRLPQARDDSRGVGGPKLGRGPAGSAGERWCGARRPSSAHSTDCAVGSGEWAEPPQYPRAMSSVGTGGAPEGPPGPRAHSPAAPALPAGEPRFRRGGLRRTTGSASKGASSCRTRRARPAPSDEGSEPQGRLPPKGGCWGVPPGGCGGLESPAPSSAGGAGAAVRPLAGQAHGLRPAKGRTFQDTAAAGGLASPKDGSAVPVAGGPAVGCE